jgi:Zn-dependent protease
MPTRQGSFRLFKLFGIEVFLHWSWFLVVLYAIEVRKGMYSSVVWNVFECLTLFAIVLIHEFGHALACRSVGGQANQIVLWPFGGVAYVSPPQRPGAQLWSIAAGPLVNVVLFPIFSVIFLLARSAGWQESIPNIYTYVEIVWLINLVLLIFNMLPIYPLDGGQILRSLLWFLLGRAQSLMVATVVGFIGAAGLIFFAIFAHSIWLGAMCVLILLNCFQGFLYARELLRIGDAPRRGGYLCPNCKMVPPAGDFWTCGRCRQKFDPFTTQLTCPHCGIVYSRMACLECGAVNSPEAWISGAASNT